MMRGYNLLSKDTGISQKPFWLPVNPLTSSSWSAYQSRVIKCQSWAQSGLSINRILKWGAARASLDSGFQRDIIQKSLLTLQSFTCFLGKVSPAWYRQPLPSFPQILRGASCQQLLNEFWSTLLRWTSRPQQKGERQGQCSEISLSWVYSVWRTDYILHCFCVKISFYERMRKGGDGFQCPYISKIKILTFQ